MTLENSIFEHYLANKTNERKLSATCSFEYTRKTFRVTIAIIIYNKNACASYKKIKICFQTCLLVCRKSDNQQTVF